MIRAAWFARVLALGLVLPASAQEVVVRTSLKPDGAVVIGQQVQFFVDVLFADEMVHPPRVAAPRVEGTQVFRFETQATTFSERIAGREYTGQRFEFDLYPRRAGTLAVPAPQIDLLDRTGGVVGARTGAAQAMRVVAPPGLDPSGPIAASSSMTMDEHWQPSDNAFHVGDAVTRRVTRSAASLPGLALPALDFAAPAGMRAYVDTPVIEDQVERGSVTGRRIDRVTYVFEQPGSYVLPGLAQPWWDLQAGAAHTLTVPPRQLEVIAAPVSATAIQPMSLAPALYGVVGLLGMTALYCGCSAWRRRSARADRIALRTLRRACRHMDPASAYRAWQCCNALRPDRRLLPPLAEAVATLERALFGHGTSWDRAAANRLIDAARQDRLYLVKKPADGSLPPLNPSHTAG